MTREGTGGPGSQLQQAAQSTRYVWDDGGFRKPRLQAAQVVFIVATNLTARLL